MSKTSFPRTFCVVVDTPCRTYGEWIKQHDAKVRADAKVEVIDEILKYYECSFGGLVVPVRKIKQITAEIMEELKENSNECKHNEDGECFSKWDCVYKQADLNPDGTVNIYKCGKEQKDETI